MKMVIDLLTHTGIRKQFNFTVQQLFQEMEQNGVDKCMTCCQVEHIDNTTTFQTAGKYPEKIIPFATVNPWTIGSEEELERCFKEYSMKGLKLNCQRYGLAADRHSLMDPIFELCSKYHRIVIGHSMSDLFSLPSKWEEMARTFPDVPIIISHMGVPMMVDAAFLAAKRCKNIYFNTAACFAPVLNSAIREIGPERILFCSDTPFGSMRQEMQKVRYVTKDRSVQDLIFGENAERLLAG
jgi:predicted TIM-barrel fold metal-dependent hydrolase